LILPEGTAARLGKRITIPQAGEARIDGYLSPDRQLLVGHVFGVIGEEHETIFCSRVVTKEWGLPSGLVLLEGDGHYWLAFDYRTVDANPPLILIEAESCSWLTVATNFQDFLDVEAYKTDDLTPPRLVKVSK